jgi:Putative beta-barrel porin 2
MMPSGKRGRRLAGLIAGLSAVAGHARAFDPADLFAFSAGPLLLRPHAGIEEGYNDNIYYRSSQLHPVGDLVTTINPGLTVSLGREETLTSLAYDRLTNPLGIGVEEERNFISVDYSAASRVYASQDSLDTTEQFVTIRGRIKGQRLKLEGSDNIQFLSSILGQGYNAGPLAGKNIEHTVFADSYTLSYVVSPKTTAYAVASHNATEYAAGTPLYSINTVEGTLGFSAQLLARTSFFGEVYYGQTAVKPELSVLPDGPHADVNGGFIGARGRFTEKLSASVKAGYEVQSFSNHASGLSAPVVEAALSERFSEKTTVSLNYSRHGYVSVQAEAVGYTADVVGAAWDQIIGQTGKLTGSLGINYSSFEYGSSGVYARRHDDWYTIHAGLAYKFNLWMTGSIGYAFQRFSSNYSSSIVDYDANRVTLKLIVGY